MKKNSLCEISIEEILNRRITSNTQIPEEQPLVKINGALFCKVGGLSVVMGKPKAGKSTIMEIILTESLRNNQETRFDTLGFDITPLNGKSIVVIDTEQSKGDLKDTLSRVKQQLKLEHDPENLYYFYLRQDAEPKYRQDFVKSVLQQIPNIQLLIIDGFADMVSDPVTNVTDSKKLVADLLAYSDKYNIGIIGAIHQNFHDSKTVGHLGSELEKKANGIIQVEKKDGYHSISTNALRKSANFDPIYFKKDELGHSYQIDKSETGKSKQEEQAKDIEEQKTALKHCFKEDNRIAEVLLKKELRTRLQRFLYPKERELTDATRKAADRRISKMFDYNLITTDGTPDRLKPTFTINI